MDCVPDKKSVAEAVLNGGSASALARELGVSCRVVYRIVNRYCLEANPRTYRRLRSEVGYSFYEYPVGSLRHHKEEFINKLQDKEISRASSIWRLEGISGITLSGLYKNRIDTIYEFLRYKDDELRKLNQVTIDGVRKVRAVLVVLGIAEQALEPDA